MVSNVDIMSLMKKTSFFYYEAVKMDGGMLDRL